jgi:hypothetical protein
MKNNFHTHQIITLPRNSDPRGNLSFFENGAQLPFEIKRSYWIYDVPGGAKRGGHAYRKSCEFIIALSGSFDIIIDDGKERKIYSLNRSYYGLYVPQMCWREMNNFSTNSFALVVASTKFNESDYIRNYETFLDELNLSNDIKTKRLEEFRKIQMDEWE